MPVLVNKPAPDFKTNGVMPDGSSQAGYLVCASSHALTKGEEAPVGFFIGSHGN